MYLHEHSGGHARRILPGWWAAVGCAVVSFATTAIAAPPHPGAPSEVAGVPNPRPRGWWISDVANIIPDENEAALNSVLEDLERRSSVEMAVVTLPGVDGDVKSFATALFNYWHIGKRDSDNGVLVLVAVRQRRIEIETGYGVEDRLPDALIGRIIQERIAPGFKRADYANGLANGIQALVARLNESQVSSSNSLRSEDIYQRSSAGNSPVVLALAVVFMLVLAWILGSGFVLIVLSLVDFMAQEPPHRRTPPTFSTCHTSFRRLRRGLRKNELAPDQLDAENCWQTFHRVWRCPECAVVKIQPSGRIRALVEKVVAVPAYFWVFVGRVIQILFEGTSSSRSSSSPPRDWSYSDSSSFSSGSSYSGSSSSAYRSSSPSSTSSSSSSGSFGGGSSGGGGAGGSW